ncbi:MAG TPA: hypothetical protein EYH06_13200 [Chromatiales bacterium]|nr:hypothetical protein [Thiotrichales bacterium]HIP69520.1 hypothetical protein [Chromatiales bacterium]
MTALLASVRNLDEAILALRGCADMIDLKNPEEGALGALPISTVKTIVDKIGKHTVTSATIGDLPPDPETILRAVNQLQQAAVEIIKIGFFPGEHKKLASALRKTNKTQKIVAVLFADLEPDLTLLETLAENNFYGVMLDTAKKNNRGLLKSMEINQLKIFIKTARQLGLFCGLAGQLQLTDIPQLLTLKPDYLGFRSALCFADRSSQLSVDALNKIRNALPIRNSQSILQQAL